MIGRYSGDELSILLTGVHFAGVAEEIRSTVERELPITVSIGLAELSEATKRADLMFLAAGMAVSQAKHAGRNRIRQFESFQLKNSEDLGSFLQQGSYSAVRALAEAVDAKDEYTRGHSRRVAQYARALARAAGYDSGFVDLVFITGTLHDVGKIGTPDSILKKQGKLTDDEFLEIAKHPVLGEKIVSQIPQLRDSLPGIRHHHERWDGRGYPDKLSQDSIPLIARVLAVADTYDAMTSDRPYRKGLSHDIAFKEIERGAGTQFDPYLVEVFLREDVMAFRDEESVAQAA